MARRPRAAAMHIRYAHTLSPLEMSLSTRNVPRRREPPGPALLAHHPMPVPRAPPLGLSRQLATRLLASGKQRRTAAPSATSRGCSRQSRRRIRLTRLTVGGRARHERSRTAALAAARLTERDRPAPRAVRRTNRAAPADARTVLKPRPHVHSHAAAASAPPCHGPLGTGTADRNDSVNRSQRVLRSLMEQKPCQGRFRSALKVADVHANQRISMREGSTLNSATGRPRRAERPNRRA